MLSLVKLYRTVKPTASTEDINRAIKRKFLSGVSPDLRRSIFIFCTNPYATSVTYDALLEAARKAKLLIINPSNDSSQPSASATTPVVAEPTLQVVNELANKFNQHMALMDQPLSQQEAQLNATVINHQLNPIIALSIIAIVLDEHLTEACFKTTNANTTVSSNTGEITCYKCGFPNHIARNCTQKNQRFYRADSRICWQ